VHLSEFQRDPDMAVVYEIETHQSSRLAEEQIREMAKMYQDILAEIVELGQQEGFIRKNLYVGLVKRFILGAVEETINTWLRSGRGYDLVSMADPLVDLLLRGIGNPERTALKIQENP
jgi:TetR/AcrR family fatty acid metabolism transcriptional regulator